MRIPAQLDFGPYTLHVDVLVARLLRQRRRIRRWSIGTVTLVSILVLVLLAWRVLPWLHGTGTVVLASLPTDTSVTITIDGRPLHPGAGGSFTLPSGRHTLRAEQTNHFPVTVDFTVTRSMTVTVALPPLRPIPTVQPVALPSPEATWAQVAQDAGGGWRIEAQLPMARTNTSAGWGPAVTERSFRSLLHLDHEGVTRLSLFDAYPVADEVITASGARYWATWEPATGSLIPVGSGSIVLDTPVVSDAVTSASAASVDAAAIAAARNAAQASRGTEVISTTRVVRGLWWAPEGRALLVAQSQEQGQRLWLLTPAGSQGWTAAHAATPIPIPGPVQSVHWHPYGQAVVVVSGAEPLPSLPPHATTATPTASPTAPRELDEEGVASTFPTRSALLIRFVGGGDQVTVTRLQAPPNRAGGAVLLAWSAHELWWGADTGLGLALTRTALTDGRSVRVGSLPRAIVALTVRDEANVRLLLAEPDGHLTVVRWPSLDPLFTLPSIKVTPSMASVGGGALHPGGLWNGEELVVATSATNLWYILVAAEALWS